MKIVSFTGTYKENIEKLKTAVDSSDKIVIGAGAGLSTSAGYTYSGERFERYFSDYKEKYGVKDMYSAGFYPFKTPEEKWAYWSRYIFINRYTETPKPVYSDLLKLVKDKNYFVITTNVDHCFQKAGFDKQRLFYTQGDYGLFQCSVPCHMKTYDNASQIREMVNRQNDMRIPSELIPKCPVCGKEMTTNLRADDRFVEDEGWHAAAKRYDEFIGDADGRMLFLELGVGYNTPMIIKYPFLRMTLANPDAVYACVNYGEATTVEQIKERSVCIDDDIGAVLCKLLENR